MIYTQETISKMKGAVKDAVKIWCDSKIDDLFGRGSMVGTYLKRGMRNYMVRSDEAIDGAIDTLSLFAADEQGRIDTDVFFDDAMKAFEEMERRETQIGAISIEYGQGEILMKIPHSIMYDMVFGRFGTIRIESSDIRELKALLRD